KVLIASALINGLFMLPYAFSWLFFPLLFPLFVITLFSFLYQPSGLFPVVQKMISLTGENFFRVIGLFLILLLVSFIIYFFIDSPVIWLFVEVFKWNVMLEQETVNLIYDFILRFITLFSIHLILPISFTGFALQYFSLKEINDASNLKQRIEWIGMKNGKG
ncbi:MAG TPA: hypothetical protein PLD84_12090, partial [Chitinophagales bacterium]|nr:hypothetical protein [Chitinophagales bacterium]